MKVEKIEDFELSIKDIVNVTEMGNIIEVRYLSRTNTKPTIKMLENRQYVKLSTGEIKDCKERSGKRIDRINSLQASLRRLRNIINTNIVDAELCQWITLTYRENMQDPRQLYKDFEQFHKRYTYYLAKKSVKKPEYISVVEPQGRGAYHIHLLYIFSKKPPFVPNSNLRDIWGHGFVKITSLTNVDNVGAYLTAYLGDIPIESIFTKDNIKNDLEMENMDDYRHIKVDVTTGKKYLKGGRLHFYPANMNIYRCSKGIKKPITEKMTYKDAKEKTSNTMLTYQKTVRLLDSEKDFQIDIHTEYYNKLRKVSEKKE